MANGNGLSPWAYGDPETTGAAQASMAMEPAVTDYLHKLSTGQIAASGLRALDVPYDPSQSFAANALNPARLQAAQNIAMGFSGGGLQFEAFHGTPAQPFTSFADEFMGKGEGAQAYSWGHYVAQEPQTARAYIPEVTTNLKINGQPWEPTGELQDYHVDMAHQAVLDADGNVGQAIFDLHSSADDMGQTIATQGHGPSSWQAEHMEDQRSAADYLLHNQSNITSEQAQTGNFAHVNVIPDHEEFLDWHEQFSNQEPGVQNKLNSMMAEPNSWGNRTGEEIYDDLVGSQMTASNYKIPWNQARMQASKQLDAAGIPGMRFKDQGSRNFSIAPLTGPGPSDVSYQVIDHGSPWSYAPQSKVVSEHPTLDEAQKQLKSLQTYNYVLYDPKNIEITHWNGVPVSPVEGTPPGLPDVSGTAPPGGAP